MKVGLHVPMFEYDGGAAAIAPTLAELGRAADDAGLGALSVMDHYFQMMSIGGPELNMLEGYTTLGFLAANTRTVDLQLLVTGVTYRHPGLLAKIISTLDVLSGGRAVLGIGAAWYEEEHRGLGVPFPPVAERFERLEETLRICKQMWSKEDVAFEGAHYRLERTLNLPQPLRTPPIMIGGAGEQKTLRLVAEYADACNLFAGPDGPGEVAHKLEVLRGHCERVGRPYEEITKTVLWNGRDDVTQDPDGFVEQMRPLAQLGISDVRLMPPRPDPVSFTRDLGERVVPKLARL